MRNFYVVLDYTSAFTPIISYVGIAPTVNPPPAIIQTWPEPDPVPNNRGLSVAGIIFIVLASILVIVGIVYGVKIYIKK